MDSEPHLLLRLLHQQEERRDAIAHVHLLTFATSCDCVDTSRIQRCYTSFASPLLVFSAGTVMPLDNITSAETIHIRTLFGSAIALALPARFEDVSDYRPVPNHQEVWTDAGLDQSLLVEIVEHQTASDQDSLRLYYQDLAEQNQAAYSQIQEIQTLGSEQLPRLSADVFKGLVIGIQSVSKGRQGPEAANDVQVQLAVLRLPQHQSDILISLNTPVFITAESAAAQHAGAGQKTAHLDAPRLFLSILQTLQIKDYGLFG